MPLKKNNDNSKLITLDIEIIKKKVADNIRKPIESIEDLGKSLAIWFCLRYNLPYKNDILDRYTLEDLIFEYYDILFRTNPKELENYMPLDEQKNMLNEDEEWVKKQQGENYISAEEQSKMLEEAHKSVIRPEISVDANGNPIVAEVDGMPDDFKTNFEHE